MRRPAKTRAQKQHDKQQRALLRLRKTAVRWANASDENDIDYLTFLRTDVDIACHAYADTLNKSQARRLVR
jgi:hypothetical protein